MFVLSCVALVAVCSVQQNNSVHCLGTSGPSGALHNENGEHTCTLGHPEVKLQPTSCSLRTRKDVRSVSQCFARGVAQSTT